MSSFFWLASACAESAIPEADQAADDSPDEPTGEVDAGQLDAAVTTTRDASPRADASTRDASTDSGDASITRDAGLDASRPDATVDAGRDAAVQDTGTPTVVDSGTQPMACSNGQTTCGNICVDTTSDKNNCGGCGKACAADQTCSNNICSGGAPAFTVPSGCASKTLGSHGYAFCTNRLSWTDARRACLDAKLDLVIIGDAAESDFATTNGESWIAANDRTDEGQFLSVVPGNANRVNGAAVTYTKWKSGEPNNTSTCDGYQIPVIDSCLGARSDEDCGMLNTDGTWNDADCSQRRGFVCETY